MDIIYDHVSLINDNVQLYHECKIMYCYRAINKFKGGYEIMHTVSRAVENVSYCFSKPSLNLQGHMYVLKIVNLVPISGFS